ncbi:MAG: hypothetical protein LBH43_11990 [Treponema sp.]|jgi:hypothetical protein|nr:hypothetical protein [Treponema sp.]
MPREMRGVWDDLVGAEQNPKDCEDCLNMIDMPRMGHCKAYPDLPGKPIEVIFDGASCPKKVPAAGGPNV